MSTRSPHIPRRWFPESWMSDICWGVRFEINRNGYVESIEVYCHDATNGKVLGATRQRVDTVAEPTLLDLVRELMIKTAVEQSAQVMLFENEPF